jgi:transcription antitermination factor NusG
MKRDKSVRWYVFTVPYDRELKVKRALDQLDVESYVPMAYTYIEREGQRVRVIKPAISNLIFIHSSLSFLSGFKKEVEASTPIKYMMDKGEHQPIVVNDEDMDNFIRVTKTMNEELVYLEENRYREMKIGSRVRVTDGPFKNTEGYVVKIKKDKRVLVSIPGVSMVATAFIPPALMERCDC